MGQPSGPGADPEVVRVVLLNPLNQNENVQTCAVSDDNLWWTYITNKYYMLSFEK